MRVRRLPTANATRRRRCWRKAQVARGRLRNATKSHSEEVLKSYETASARDDVLRHRDRTRLDLDAGANPRAARRSAARSASSASCSSSSATFERRSRATSSRQSRWRWRARWQSRRCPLLCATRGAFAARIPRRREQSPPRTGRTFPGSSLAGARRRLPGALSRRAARCGQLAQRRHATACPTAQRPGSATLVAGNRRGTCGAQRSHRRSALARRARCSPSQVTMTASSFTTLATFSVLGVLATGGTPSDVAIDARADASPPPTRKGRRHDRVAVAMARFARRRRSAWRRDRRRRRDPTRSSSPIATSTATARSRASPPTAASPRVVTGRTAEGLAIDQRRALVYVANVNDGTVAVVDARSMRVVRRFAAVARVFSLALSPDGLAPLRRFQSKRRFAVCGAGGGGRHRPSPPRPRIVARSGESDVSASGALSMRRTGTLFVTDEELDVVDVLDARTLAAKHAPLPTCRTPWKPTIDSAAERLYVPCARDDAHRRFDARTLRRVARCAVCDGQLSARRRGMAGTPRVERPGSPMKPSLLRARRLRLRCRARLAPANCPSTLAPAHAVSCDPAAGADDRRGRAGRNVRRVCDDVPQPGRSSCASSPSSRTAAT